MWIDFYGDLKKVANKLDLADQVLGKPITVRGNSKTGDLTVRVSSGMVPQPVTVRNTLTLKYEKGVIRSVTRDLTVIKGRDHNTNLYITENYIQEWRFK